MKKRFIILPLVVLLLSVAIWKWWFRPKRLEHFLEPKAYEVIVIPRTVKKQVVAAIEPQPNTVVINQSAHRLNAPLEFEVNNPETSTDDMQEMAKQILPTNAGIKFVVLK